jgi:hypothetical protein
MPITQTPWTIHQWKTSQDDSRFEIQFGTDGECVADCVYTIDDAMLIAAAPDMLEALENLENDDGTMMPASAWKLVKDAIKKAKG